MAKKLIRFDWAMKRLLRDKANFDILERFLSELLQENIKIKHILDSESNKEAENDKHNRVDILVENSKGELIIIEIQNSKEFDYFQRMLYGVSKAVSEHISAGQPYAAVKKIIAVTIAHFDLDQGKDYVYHGATVFKELYKNDVLPLSEKQVDLYQKQTLQDLYPEYWIIKVDKFSNRVHDKLDEWIYFFKNSEIKSAFSAKGLQAANERLDELNLSEKDRKSYQYYLKELHDIASENHTKEADLIFARKDGEKLGKIEVAEKALLEGMHTDLVSKITALSMEEVEALKRRIQN